MIPEAETGDIEPQAKKHLEIPEAGRHKERNLSRAFRESIVLLTL